MSTPDKPDLARGWRYVEKLLAGEEEDDVGEKAGEHDERSVERRPDDTEPVTEWRAEELLAMAASRAAQKRATAVQAAPQAPARVPAGPQPSIARVVPVRRRWRAAWLMAATLVVALVIYAKTRDSDVVAHARPSRQLAEAERDAAEASCARKEWATCEEKLDKAAELDPAGESEPRVQRARQAVALGTAGPPAETGVPQKPGP